MTSSKSVGSSDGVPIVYESQGTSPETLVFVHGWACNRSHWRNQIQAFSRRYRTIALDLGGHGESGVGRSEWTMSAFADDVVAVMDREQVDQAILFGHSMGGPVVLRAAQQLGARVVGLVGADTLKSLRSDPRDGPLVDRLRKLKDDYQTRASEWIASMFNSESTDSIKKAVTDGMLATPSAIGIGALKAMIKSGSSFDLAVALDMPKFTINAHGPHVDMAAAAEAGMEVRFVSTGGHFVMLEDPETFNRYVEEALGEMF